MIEGINSKLKIFTMEKNEIQPLISTITPIGKKYLYLQYRKNLTNYG